MRGRALPIVSDVLDPVVASLPPESLAVQLKRETDNSHRETERVLDIFGRVTNLRQYSEWLQQSYRLYRPLESALAGFDKWEQYDIVVTERAQSGRLASDLNFLGVRFLDLEDSPNACLPVLQSFPSALGAMYVLEGSKLGSIYILSHFKTLMAERIVGADSFFNGHGEHTATFWHRFKASLDSFGLARPSDITEVVQGAKSTFAAIGSWMQY